MIVALQFHWYDLKQEDENRLSKSQFCHGLKNNIPKTYHIFRTLLDGFQIKVDKD